MAPRRGFPARVQRTKRLTSWGFGPEDTGTGFSASGKALWTNSVLLAAGHTPATIVRMRGLVTVGIESATAADDGFAGAVGIALVTIQAFTQGVIAVPGPMLEMDWGGWLYHRFFDIRVVDNTIGNGVNAVRAIERWEVDSKAMRKWGDEFILVGVMEVVENATAVMRIHGDLRILLKLS